MKTWITQTAAGVIALAAVSLSACKKDEVQATLTPTNSVSLTASTANVVLTQATAANTAATFTFTPLTFAWANVDKPYNPAVTYTLQVAKQGTNFANLVSSIDLGAGPSKAITVGDLNTPLLSGGLPVGTATPLDIRLKAVYAANSPLYSTTLPLTATVYCAQPAASQAWSIIGPAAKDWNTDIVMTYDCALNAYTYTGPFVADVYKFRYGGVVGNWAANLGGASSTGGALTQGGGNLSIAKAGTYTITLKPAGFKSTGAVEDGSTYTIK
ncbi:MAG: SusF/SusE family outer membrane protein [Hymenobacter sp.]|nr:MAG: SusF/SusE family outer membrane protein [Hymenobacter sp.]